MSIFFGRPDLMVLFLAQVLLIVLQLIALQRLSIEMNKSVKDAPAQSKFRSRAKTRKR